MDDLITIKNVNGYLDKNGVAHLNLEDVARGLGFTENKSGKEYVMWRRVKGYLDEFGLSSQVPKNDFIPENIFYKLCFKASNETARKFQDIVTDEILPEIRKHGAYITDAKIEEILSNPDTIISLATQIKDERAKNKELETELEKKDQLIGELQPKADYVDYILASTGVMATSQIAADYGLTANKLNKILKEERIQRRVGDQWILYAEYFGQGYTKSETILITRSDGRPDTKLFTKWTQKGRLMINEVLNKRGIYAYMDIVGRAV